jgi:hypothetical protein
VKELVLKSAFGYPKKELKKAAGSMPSGHLAQKFTQQNKKARCPGMLRLFRLYDGVTGPYCYGGRQLRISPKVIFSGRVTRMTPSPAPSPRFLKARWKAES